MAATSSCISFLTSSYMVVSPHSRRCSPKSQISPGLVTASSGTSGTSSSLASEEVSCSPKASSSFNSSSENPKISRLNSSSPSSFISSASISSSQPAFRAILLSAMTNAHRCRRDLFADAADG